MRVPSVPSGSHSEPTPQRAVPQRPPAPSLDDVPSASDMVVLSEAAYRALARARQSGAIHLFEQRYPLPALESEVHVSVRPTAEAGTVYVRATIHDPQKPQQAVHLEGAVRESWLERVQRDAATEKERAWQTVQALAELAGVPGQRTVVVRTSERFGLDVPIRGPVPPVTGAWLPAEYPPEALLPSPFGGAE